MCCSIIVNCRSHQSQRNHFRYRTIYVSETALPVSSMGCWVQLIPPVIFPGSEPSYTYTHMQYNIALWMPHWYIYSNTCAIRAYFLEIKMNGTGMFMGVYSLQQRRMGSRSPQHILLRLGANNRWPQNWQYKCSIYIHVPILYTEPTLYILRIY